MGLLNRQDRQVLRSIQAHMHAAVLDARVVFEQIGTVDVMFHPINADPFLNCVTPHRGVAWIRRDDLGAAFTGLERLGRVPRLVFQDALFPDAFQQQIALMGLTLENARMVMLYRPVSGPVLPGETPRGRLPETFEVGVTAKIAATQPDLAAWLRIFHAGYYRAESVVIDPATVEPLVAAAEEGNKLFITAYFEGTPLGVARVGLRETTAELELVVTAPLWHTMGLEPAMVTIGVQAALEHGCEIIFTIAPSREFEYLYHRLGFVELTRVLTFWLAEGAIDHISGKERNIR